MHSVICVDIVLKFNHIIYVPSLLLIRFSKMFNWPIFVEQFVITTFKVSLYKGTSPNSFLVIHNSFLVIRQLNYKPNGIIPDKPLIDMRSINVIDQGAELMRTLKEMGSKEREEREAREKQLREEQEPKQESPDQF